MIAGAAITSRVFPAGKPAARTPDWWPSKKQADRQTDRRQQDDQNAKNDGRHVFT
jgi:hypothetical protein